VLFSRPDPLRMTPGYPPLSDGDTFSSFPPEHPPVFMDKSYLPPFGVNVVLPRPDRSLSEPPPPSTSPEGVDVVRFSKEVDIFFAFAALPFFCRAEDSLSGPQLRVTSTRRMIFE